MPRWPTLLKHLYATLNPSPDLTERQLSGRRSTLAVTPLFLSKHPPQRVRRHEHSRGLRAERLGERYFELLRDQHDRLKLLREGHRMLRSELGREHRKRLEAQDRVTHLMWEHPHLELELQHLTVELELEREGRTHNHFERQRWCEIVSAVAPFS